MSVDEDVTRDLIQTLKDGEQGFTSAAERLAQSNRPDLVGEFRRFATQRSEYVTELTSLASVYGDRVSDESGSVAATLHRGWMAVKDTIAGSDPGGVLDAAEQGEDHTVAAYSEALDKEISPTLRSVIESQYTGVRAAHDTVRALRDSVS